MLKKNKSPQIIVTFVISWQNDWIHPDEEGNGANNDRETVTPKTARKWKDCGIAFIFHHLEFWFR